VLEALRAGRPINKVLLAEGIGRPAGVEEILRLAKDAMVVVERVDRRAVDRLSPDGRSQGVVALAAVKDYVDLEQLLEIARERGEPPLLIALDHIEDPHNLGAIIRTADAAGVHGVIIPQRRAAALTGSVARASAGAVEYVPVARIGNLSNALASLAKEDVWTVGIDPSGQRDYTEVDYRQPTAIVIGAEGKGLSRLIKERCDLLASIPMRGRIASLNASVAAALVMYEAARQRSTAEPG
jgi:23S rRNA (guanosine2251-2'-O)-methyltransferase